MSKTITTRYDVAEHLRTPEEMAAYLERLACNDTSCVNTMAQFAAMEAVAGPQDEVKKMLEEYKARSLNAP